MKKIFLIIVTLFLGLSIFISDVFAKYNLIQPEDKSIEINGQVYDLSVYKYDPPYLTPQYYIKNRSEEDLSTPEEARIAMASAYGRDTEWYLSLFDEESRKEQVKIDKETCGRYFEEFKKGKPYPDAIKEGNYSKLLYKIEFKYENNLYAVIYKNSYLYGNKISESGGSYSCYVMKKGEWLFTDKIEKHPLVWLAGLHSYSQLQELCQNGYWYTPDAKKPIRLKVELSSDKKEYEYKESINLKVKIENIWREDVTICSAFKPLGKTVRFTIESKQNDIDDEDSIITDVQLTKKDFVVLNPSDYKEITYKRTEYLLPEIANQLLIPDKCVAEKDGTVYYPPGEYTVKVRYSTLGVDNNDCIIPREGLGWYSEPITIKVLLSEEYNTMIEEKNNPSISDEEPEDESKADKQLKIYLKNGNIVKGRIVREDKDTMDVRRDFGDNHVFTLVNKEDIEKIEELE